MSLHQSAKTTYRCSAVSVLGAALGLSTIKGEANAGVAVGTTAGSIGGDGTSGGWGGTCRRRGACRRRIRGTGCRVTVPVGLGLVHAFAHGDTLKATCLESLDYCDGQVQSSQLVNVVGNSKLASSVRLDGAQVSNEVVLGYLDLLSGELVVVISVQVEVRDHVSKVL